QLFHNWAELRDGLRHLPPVDAVIELMGGIDDCLPIYRHFLGEGVPIITANKALLAECGSELFPLARKNRTCIACEASCGGGIPILQTLLCGLRANQIHEFHGVLNGTCNFILSKMAAEGRSYRDVLCEAQACGLAEADPFLDVSGTDSAHKLAILAAMSFGLHFGSGGIEEIPISGIANLQPVHICAGNKLGLSLKLLASAKLGSDRSLALRVGPYYIPRKSSLHTNFDWGLPMEPSPLAFLEGSFNGVSFYGDNVGHVYLQGRGAGASATASAVLADLYQVLGGSYPLVFADFPYWVGSPAQAGNQWAYMPQNWLGFAETSLPAGRELFSLDGYRVFYLEQYSQVSLPDFERYQYIPILQVPEERLQGEREKSGQSEVGI
ncbi:MAG: homoserine dehydrogenase, partial [Spirochaetota bacterium]